MIKMIKQKITIVGLSPNQIHTLHELFDGKAILHDEIISCEIADMNPDEVKKWFDGMLRLPLAKLESCKYVPKHYSYTIEINILVAAVIISPSWFNGEDTSHGEKFNLHCGLSVLTTIYKALEIFPQCDGMSMLNHIPTK